MIVLSTDFGGSGPYMGQIEAAIRAVNPSVTVIRLFSDLPAFDIVSSSYLLAAYPREFPQATIFLCVVDPGVGTSERQPVIVQADEQWFVGPDNGLFDIICKRAKNVERWRIDTGSVSISASFHGRDLFAPAAATLAAGQWPRCERLGLEGSPWMERPEDWHRIIYLDHYGNAVSGIRAFQLTRQSRIIVAGRELAFRRVYGEADTGVPFWYENSNGLVEIALPSSSVARELGLRIGDALRIIAD